MAKPSESNAQQQLPLTLLVSQIIDIATDHANLLGIGFLNLEPKGLGWVLSRLSVEMKRWPRTGEEYTLTTWIESYNAHFSERCFSVVSASGEVLGYARTIWVIIDLANHQSMGTAHTVMPPEMLPAFDCPIPKFAKRRTFIPETETEYTFRYTDVDFYRHVNTVKYIALLLNQFTLEDFDSSSVSRFDIAFAHEARYGEIVKIKSIAEPVPTPGMASSNDATTAPSVMHSFDLSVGTTTILFASLTLTPN